MTVLALDLGQTKERVAAHGLTAARCYELLHYNPQTGIFTWRVMRGGMAAGSQAGSVIGSGYIYISIDDHPYLAHQLAWLMMTGEWPGHFTVDHRDTIKTNNAWVNLRAASRSQQCMNRGVSSNNTSGAKGVSWSKSRCCWRAYVSVDGKQHFAGYYDDFDAAVSARNTKATELHGEFARAA